MKNGNGIKKLMICLFVFSTLSGLCQQKGRTETRGATLGFELDVLPYITGGYYGSVWAGHQHMRYRAIITSITTPEFLLSDGFTNNKIQAYAAIVDYFFKQGFEKWWIGGGLEYWNEQIQTNARISTGKYTATIVTLGTGYVWKFHKNFYLNPWA